jgi:hypothetical protein
MANGTFLNLPHEIDIYTKTTSVNDAGQRVSSFTFGRTVKSLFTAVSAERRVYPYVGNINEVQFYISYRDADLAGYNNRIQNIVDRFGNVIETGPFEIIQINKQTGLNGKLRQVLLICRLVTEGA